LGTKWGKMEGREINKGTEIEMSKAKGKNDIHYFIEKGKKVPKNKKEELKQFYNFDDTTLVVDDYTDKLFKRFFDTIYRDYLLTKRNLVIYHTIDSKLHRGGNNSIKCDFFDILRENTWSIIVIRLYGLYSTSKNDFYSLNNFISICKHKYKVDLGEIESQIIDYHCDKQYGFDKIIKLRNKIHAHRDPDSITNIDRNLITQIPMQIAKKLIEKIIKESSIKPYKYEKGNDADHYKGSCIWDNIDLEKTNKIT